MNRFTAVTLMNLALCGLTQANITPTNTSITGSGPFIWTYNLQLSNDQNVNSGAAPSTNPVAHANQAFAGFFTIYDFGGYINGSCTGPVGWTCTSQNIGFTPDDVVPFDNPAVANITWVYTSGPTILGQPLGKDMGFFSAQSIYNVPTQVSYAGRGVKNIGGSIGSTADNVGNTQAPLSIGLVLVTPEPAFTGAVGMVLVLLALMKLRPKAE